MMLECGSRGDRVVLRCDKCKERVDRLVRVVDSKGQWWLCERCAPKRRAD